MKKSGRKKKRHVIRNLFLLAVVAAAGAGAWTIYQSQLETDTEETVSYRQETVKYGSVITGITESGTVTYGTADQTFEVAEVSSSSSSSSSTSVSSSMYSSMTSTVSASTSTSSASLEVEEVYVAVGQVVSEGDALLKITQESIEAYREELESAITSAELTVKQEEINVQTKQAEADYTYAMYIAEGETAEATYNATITSLENTVTELEEDLEEAAEELEELQSEYDAGEDVEDDLEAAQLNYDTIEANLEIAKNNLTTQSISAKQTYENAMTNYEYADQLYEIDTDGLEDDLDDAKEALEDAEEALAEFEEQIGDGVIYSEYSGTVMSISYSAGDTLTSDSTVVTFADADDVTMTVAVSQSDISSISTGDAVSIELTAYEAADFDGTVTSFSTTATTGSSTVNYEVTVAFTGDISKVYSGMTGEVTFITKEEADTLYISVRAVHTDGATSYVKVLQDDGTIEEVTITTGYSNGTTVAVTSGLEQGQIVLIESQVTG
ncbi:MAG: efflux RND transporter periplasmic adaptor subunit [Lachnospiraceae bacterium]|nr:efflux RND transporter periplasmic adaptor subunit [Lachnospiraceae bacterium]